MALRERIGREASPSAAALDSQSVKRQKRGRTGPRQDMPALPLLELIWADGGYNAWQVEAALAKVPRLRMEIVKRSDDTKSFVVLPRRRIMPLGAIPRTFGSSS